MNKSTRVAIHCEFCNFEACRKCNERYVANESSVKCMNTSCGREWSRKFIRKSFTLKFVNGDLKKHREQILFDKERVLLPLTQAIIERNRKIDQLSAELDTLMQRSAKHHLTQKELDELDRLRNEINASFEQMKTPETKKSVFIRACPAEECRGFLNNELQCGICEKQCCPDCHVILCDTTKHECNADDLATTQLLSNDTKPCPKCATGIFKIDGCDQMWCTQCHTAFSWRTGKIENKIHNPHYYEWLRRNGGVPRNPDDVQCGGEQLTPHLVTRIRLRIEKNHPELFPIFVKCENIVRTMIHLEHHLPRPENYEHRHGIMRLDYLLNKISETKMKHQLELDERNNNKKQELCDIFLLIKTAITDIMLRISHDLREKTSNNTQEILYEIEPLLEHANECLDEISHTYSCPKMKYVFSEGGITLYKGNKPIYSTQ